MCFFLFFLLMMRGLQRSTPLYSSAASDVYKRQTGVLIKICERVIENWRYARVSRLIDGSQQTIEVHPTVEGIEQLQNLIDKRRAINVLEFGVLHNRLASKLTKLYENIIS